MTPTGPSMFIAGLVLGAMPAAALAQTASSASAVEAAAAARDVEPNQQDNLDTLTEEKPRASFREGSSLTFAPRTYYRYVDRDIDPDSVGWALGGALVYESGWWRDRVQLGGALYTSQKLYGPQDRDGTQLLLPGQESFSVLGEAYATLRFGDGNLFRVGRQTFDLPWLAKNDSRMVPNTYESIVIGRQAKTGLAYIVGYVDSIKERDSDKFVSMSEAAGAAGSDRGLAEVGAQYTFADTSVVAVLDQHAYDVMNTLFVKGEKSFDLGNGRSLRGSAQYTDQRSTGDALIGSFDTHLTAVKAELFLPRMSFRLAYSQAATGFDLQSPFAGAPNYTSIIVENFDRAGEKAWLVGFSYDFSTRVDGLSLFTNVSSGSTPDSGPTASPDQTEYDLTVDYRFAKGGALDGLWVRLRSAWIDQDERDNGGKDSLDFRIIVNYAFDFLK